MSTLVGVNENEGCFSVSSISEEDRCMYDYSFTLPDHIFKRWVATIALYKRTMRDIATVLFDLTEDVIEVNPERGYWLQPLSIRTHLKEIGNEKQGI